MAKKSSRVQTEREGMSLSEFEQGIVDLEASRESTSVLVFGDSNVGKTVLAGTCPGKTFWLVGEPGYKSAAAQGAAGKARKISNTAAAWAAVDWLSAKPEGKKHPRYHYLDWLILDGASTMQDRFRVGYAQEAFDLNPTTRQHRNLPAKPDYFNTQNMMKTWIAALVDMPCNLLITAHAWKTDDSDVDYYVYPGFQGKVTETANAISGLMDVVGYYELQERKIEGQLTEVRRMLFKRTIRKGVRYYAGDKTNTLPRYMDNPTMPAIIAKMNGAEEE